LEQGSVKRGHGSSNQFAHEPRKKKRTYRKKHLTGKKEEGGNGGV